MGIHFLKGFSLLTNMRNHCILCFKEDGEVCLHVHHVIPQSRGGKDGPTVILCSDHHNLIHSLALKASTSIKNGKGFDFDQIHIPNVNNSLAKQLIMEVVKATVEDKNQMYKVTLEFTVLQREMLEILKQDFGASSLKKTIYSCLDEVFKARFK